MVALSVVNLVIYSIWRARNAHFPREFRCDNDSAVSSVSMGSFQLQFVAHKWMPLIELKSHAYGENEHINISDYPEHEHIKIKSFCDIFK